MTPAWTVCDMPNCETWKHLFCIGEDAPEVILSPGGLSKRISVFTNKLVNPDKCFHWDTRFVPKCKIDALSEMTPAWTVCDMPNCETWKHLFCIGEDAPEVDPWYCKPCRDGKRSPKFWKP